MIDLEKKFLGFRLRVWGLLVNFLANIIAVYGVVLAVKGEGAMLLLLGALITLFCVAVLAKPSKD